MNLVKTFIHKREYRGGKKVWVVRWKDPETGLWKSLVAGRTKNEAVILEGQVRDNLMRGENPVPKPERPGGLKVSEVIAWFRESSRFKSAERRWRRSPQERVEVAG